MLRGGDTNRTAFRAFTEFLPSATRLQVASRVPPIPGQFSLETGGQKLETVPVQKTVYLSLGSNLGDRAGNLRSAIEKLGSLGKVVALSSFYETEPVTVTEQPWFLNCAVKLDTDKMPRQLLAGILTLERQMGRRRTQSKGPRTIDIDIVLFGNSVLATADLVVPHPAMQERRFVLEPLTEIAADVRHPRLERTIRELRDALPPGQAVHRLSHT